MRHPVLVGLCLLLTVRSLAASDTDLRQQAQRAFEQGQFEKAIEQWESIRSRLSLRQQLELAAAYQSLGLAQKSVDLLENIFWLTIKIDGGFRYRSTHPTFADLLQLRRTVSTRPR